ncbi:hypothetical protein BJ166DRAFT_93870 [Pestalotiopsis sp. NC0098]|nr:hypothetical protein BJ166DRAFT_93870 [Pestalotiopsis sp. NC0098]
MPSACTGTLLRIGLWSSSQLVLLASAHQDRAQWAGVAAISSYIIWLACGLWLALTELDIVARRPRFVAIPPFLLFISLIIFGKAGLGDAVAIVPTAVNIGIVIVLEWEREHDRVNTTQEPYSY